MATKKDEKAKDSQLEENVESPLKPISANQRSRLQKCFEHGSMLSTKGEFDYADAMFRQCVSGDPGNLIYTQNLLTNLKKKYNNNKKGAKMAGLRTAGPKARLKKAQVKKNWMDAIKAGLECLHFNPWDAATLGEIAKACESLEIPESQIEYLKIALEGDLKNIALNRSAANAFAKVAHFDEAIACLERIAAQQPNNQDVAREISQMTVNKTIHRGGYDHAETSMDVSVEKQAQDKLTGGALELSEEQQLRREIRRHPEEVTNYINLSDYFFKLEDFEAAEQIMAEAVEATSAVRATEELEDIQLHRTRLELLRAKKRAKDSQKSEDANLYKRMKEELNKRELAVFASRSERYPGDLKIKYELGLRLKRVGNYEQAIQEFQQARNDIDRAAVASLETGECFQQIRQTRLALDAYEMAIDNCSASSDDETKKLALYRAGWLNMKLHHNENAQKFFSQLASIDFGFRDVSSLLDEVSKKIDQDASEA
jgi:tetratricopeptide (TPR) repeat protein